MESLSVLLKEEFKRLAIPIEPQNLYTPIHYALDSGGKRYRPMLVLLGCELFDGDIKEAMCVAKAIEVFHNFTLIHDDIMDNAPLRRGKETVFTKWSPNTAILSGDAMMICAYKFLENCSDAHLPAVLKEFNKVALEVCEGQQFDMDFETKKNVTIGDYLQMISLKTSVLLGSSLKLGGIIGNCNADEQEKLYEFGKNLGIAFQLQDDLLDVFGDKSKFGKTVGGDIVANKKTYLLLKALEIAKGNQYAELMFWLTARNKETEKVNAITRIYKELNITQFTQEKIHQYYLSALNNLSEIKVAETKKKPLIEIANTLLKRDS